MSQQEWNAPQYQQPLQQSAPPSSYPPQQPYYGAPQAYPPQYQQGGYPPKPPNHRILALLSIFFGFLIFGLIAILHSSKVDGKYMTGDFAGAEESSRRAKGWAIAAFVTGAVCLGLYIVYFVTVGLAAVDAAG